MGTAPDQIPASAIIGGNQGPNPYFSTGQVPVNGGGAAPQGGRFGGGIG